MKCQFNNCNVNVIPNEYYCSSHINTTNINLSNNINSASNLMSQRFFNTPNNQTNSINTNFMVSSLSNKSYLKDNKDKQKHLEILMVSMEGSDNYKKNKDYISDKNTNIPENFSGIASNLNHNNMYSTKKVSISHYSDRITSSSNYRTINFGSFKMPEFNKSYTIFENKYNPSKYQRENPESTITEILNSARKYNPINQNNGLIVDVPDLIVLSEFYCESKVLTIDNKEYSVKSLIGKKNNQNTNDHKRSMTILIKVETNMGINTSLIYKKIENEYLVLGFAEVSKDKSNRSKSHNFMFCHIPKSITNVKSAASMLEDYAFFTSNIDVMMGDFNHASPKFNLYNELKMKDLSLCGDFTGTKGTSTGGDIIDKILISNFNMTKTSRQGYLNNSHYKVTTQGTQLMSVDKTDYSDHKTIILNWPL
ncbi:hypothetical protein [Allofrancisella guangzhouensis]|uniref:hypothetical protein n=1 Tax=Allofrancisella guangzhouensis TaxID=594679 RepID=UPI001905B1E0|nr:hypothetical protein [Allofrancisella guangzhouensis]